MERELIEKYKELSEMKDLLTEQLEQVNKQREECITEINDYMEAKGLDRTGSYDGLGYISAVKPMVYATFAEEDRSVVFSYLSQQGRADLIKSTVNAKSLSSFVKEYLDSGEEIPETIKYILKPQVRLNKK